METWKRAFFRALFHYSAKRVRIERAFEIKHPHVPGRLYKYRHFRPDNKHIEALERGVLWICAPERSNDPFDSTTAFDIDRLLVEDKSLEEATADAKRPRADQVEGLRSKPFSKRITSGAYRDRITAWAEKLLGQHYPPETVTAYLNVINAVVAKNEAEMINAISALLRRAYGVLSLSEVPTSAPMWSHYSDNHQGFCIEYDFKSLSPDDDLRRLCFPVFYRRKRTDASRYMARHDPRDFNNLSAVLMCLLKREQWSYEREWRIVSAEGQASATRPIAMPKPSAVILGIQTPEPQQAQMAALCATSGIPLRRMAKHPHAFEVIEK